jgi:hypothetical protein
MRELIGKIATKDPNVTKSVYRSELVPCRECKKTAPLGIEVITTKKDGESKKVLEHLYYCRTHGLDYETRTQSLSFHPDRQHKSDNEAYLRNYSKRR